jgi:hypothetical protein
MTLGLRDARLNRFLSDASLLVFFHPPNQVRPVLEKPRRVLNLCSNGWSVRFNLAQSSPFHHREIT